MPSTPPQDAALLHARAACIHDLASRELDTPFGVDLLDDVLRERRWWLEQWPDGAAHLAGQVAQDLQEGLIDNDLRWPECRSCAASSGDEYVHELRIEPDLGPDPRWVCEVSGTPIAPLGHLAR